MVWLSGLSASLRTEGSLGKVTTLHSVGGAQASVQLRPPLQLLLQTLPRALGSRTSPGCFGCLLWGPPRSAWRDLTFRPCRASTFLLGANFASRGSAGAAGH